MIISKNSLATAL